MCTSVFGGLLLEESHASPSQLRASWDQHHVMIRGIEGKSIFRDNRERKGFDTSMETLLRKQALVSYPGPC